MLFATVIVYLLFTGRLRGTLETILFVICMIPIAIYRLIRYGTIKEQP